MRRSLFGWLESAPRHGPGRDGLDPEHHPKQPKVEPDRKTRDAERAIAKGQYRGPLPEANLPLNRRYFLR